MMERSWEILRQLPVRTWYVARAEAMLELELTASTRANLAACTEHHMICPLHEWRMNTSTTDSMCTRLLASLSEKLVQPETSFVENTMNATQQQHMPISRESKAIQPSHGNGEGCKEHALELMQGASSAMHCDFPTCFRLSWQTQGTQHPISCTASCTLGRGMMLSSCMPQLGKCQLQVCPRANTSPESLRSPV